MSIRNRWFRLRQQWRLWRNAEDSLARRVMVENYLINCSKGNKFPIEGEVARQLALHLGTPSDAGYRSLKQRLEETSDE